MITLTHELDARQEAVLEATERERQRIGQELHDHLCQHLLGAAFAAKALANSLPADSPYSKDADDLARLVNSAVQQTRDIVRGLHPVERNPTALARSPRNASAQE